MAGAPQLANLVDAARDAASISGRRVVPSRIATQESAAFTG